MNPTLADDWKNGGFALYVHWPFCTSKCPYCDFNSYVGTQINEKKWLTAYINDIKRISNMTGKRQLDSVFFGGGTPSLMNPNLVSQILEHVSNHWAFSPNCEVTLEANPSSAEASKFRDFRAAGINRISIGMQALNDLDLKRLGRQHSAQEAIEAYEMSKKIFQRVSIDLIYGRQYQSISQWEKELRQALMMDLDHISLYQLTIEENTTFSKLEKTGKLNGLPNEEVSAQFFEVTQKICEEHLLPLYEVSNHAKKGFESQHNLVYWRYGDYAGVGPGAHGRLTINDTKFRTESISNPFSWLKSAISGNGDELFEPINESDQGIEYLLFGLRIKEGISQSRYRNFFNMSPKKSILDDLRQKGFIKINNDRIMATNSGFLVLNQIVSNLIPDKCGLKN